MNMSKITFRKLFNAALKLEDSLFQILSITKLNKDEIVVEYVDYENIHYNINIKLVYDIVYMKREEMTDYIEFT